MKKILLVSQYKVSLERNTNLLKNWGLHILATTSGTEALKLHKEYNVDLIVSDFELEDMSGCTLCSLIRKAENLQPVPIILTCHNIPRRIERGNLSGASAVIIKPVSPIKLLEVIGDHIGLHLIRGKRVELKIVVIIKKNAQEFICVSRDISKSGILLKSDYELNIGNQIICKFTLPDYCQIEIDGEIVRYMTDLECDNLYGVKFISIEPFYQKAISDYIVSCSKRHSRANAMQSDVCILNHNKERVIEIPDRVACR